MNKEKISNAYQRASNVVNGFATVRDQQARDVVALVGVLAERDSTIEALEKKVAGLELQLAGRTVGDAQRVKAEDILGRMFGDGKL